MIYALFFLSGATSLILELVWLRGFAIVLGSTLYAFSCVLTAFTLGLAAGSALANRFVRRFVGRPRRFFVRSYGVLELAIGLSGLALTWALFRGQEVLLPIVSGAAEVDAGTVVVHFATSFALMAFPTLCMGATLPILSMALDDDVGTSSLYSFNTFGASFGCVAASFVLIYLFGCLATAGIVAAINATIFALAFFGAGFAHANDPSERARPPERATTDASEAWSASSILGLAFFSGYVFFSFELLWNRNLELILGNRVYVTSITLFLVLYCLGIGARISHAAHGRVPARRLVALGYGVAVVGVLSASWVQGDLLQSPKSWGTTLAFVGVAICLPSVAMGVVLPLLLTLPAKGAVRGVHVARLYAANLVGSVAGSLLTGYVWISLLGSGRLLLANAGLLLCAIWAFARPDGGSGRAAGFSRAGTGALLALSGYAVATIAVHWSEPVSVVPPERRIVLEEDAHGIFTIERTQDDFLSVRNNATELVFHYGRPITQYVQESQAHFPMLVAPGYERIAVIGSGFGITAGTFGRYPVGRVDAVELLPSLVRHADRFREGSYDYRNNPKIRTVVTDGRRFLALADEPYDVISINVSDPYLPGSSSLFSAEFYALVKRRLRPDGIVCQHIFGPDIASLYHGFAAHFEYVRAVPAYQNGVSLLGSDAPIRVRNLPLLEQVALATPPAAPKLPAPQLARRLLAQGDRILKELASQPAEFINSDVHPHLEFRRSPHLDMFHSNQ